MSFEPHAVHQLYQYRKAISSKPFTARGKNIVRCELCLLAEQFCTCQFRQQVRSNSAFLLIMYDDEVLKPSNSGRLIADLIPNTHAYIWSRTQPNRKILELINSSKHQPYLVFPGEYAYPEQEVVSSVPHSQCETGKKPLFILLDGSWREAIKMFRKSPYLHNLPILSFTPETVAKYGLRKGSRDFQLGTAEVAALALGACGEVHNATSLNAWFELFIESSLYSRSRHSEAQLRPLNLLADNFKNSLSKK
ncbi:tRNA-uridine aminocarboxypropyltransferase [Shewanella sp. UCD-KL12]|uniref:tRNA-uridine aminocarboxypropyltransferase n=1 Tax=Shewanella sp. UCD-KL12 TaxID=1917163 RepID=UPI00097034A4|nr:tRNA-uridine aminocarboxypropyltransferase [Shewanella sp. UCD-KL12]